MPCVYLPGPAPAVTVANRYPYLPKNAVLRIQDPFDTDPDTAFHFDTDPAFQFDIDPDPTV
jgi:hypothetical protein